MVQKKIDEEKEWAQKLVKEGYKDEAKLALTRAKLMDNELNAEEEE